MVGMKGLLRFLSVAVLLPIVASYALAQTGGGPDLKLSRKERKEAERVKVERMLADTVYIVDVTTAVPMGWKNIHLSADYRLSVNGNRVVSYLPYFGRAYSLPYGGGEGLTFEGETADYRMVQGKRGMKDIGFTVRTREDSFEFHIDISPDGDVSMTVLSNNRQPISFSGHLKLYDDPE